MFYVKRRKHNMPDTITANCPGRLGNLLFHNFVVSWFSLRYKKAAVYQSEDRFTKLGIFFHKETDPVSSDTCIKLNDSNLYVAYAHMEDLMFNKDEIIKQGDVIGYVGNTGSAEVPKLHFAIREGKIAVDPLKYIPE